MPVTYECFVYILKYSRYRKRAKFWTKIRTRKDTLPPQIFPWLGIYPPVGTVERGSV